MHYNNPEGVTGVKDQGSGITLEYTTGKARGRGALAPWTGEGPLQLGACGQQLTHHVRVSLANRSERL